MQKVYYLPTLSSRLLSLSSSACRIKISSAPEYTFQLVVRASVKSSMLFPISRSKRVARISQTSARHADKVRVLILSSRRKWTRLIRIQNTWIVSFGDLSSVKNQATHDRFISVTLYCSVLFLKRSNICQLILPSFNMLMFTDRIRLYVISGAMSCRPLAIRNDNYYRILTYSLICQRGVYQGIHDQSIDEIGSSYRPMKNYTKSIKHDREQPQNLDVPLCRVE